jgi:hypothetical protein
VIEQNNIWSWQSQQEDTFQNIKELVTNFPILKYYDVNEEVTIQRDASEKGQGAALLQNGQPVCYASKMMTESQQRYAQIEKECLAIVFACERFDQYIYGGDNITIHSDYKPLEAIFKKPLLSAPKRLQRMLLRLQKYNIDVIYKKGRDLHIADFLSRAALPNIQITAVTPQHEIFKIQHETRVFDDLDNINFADSVNISDKSLQAIREHTTTDESLQTLRTNILNGWPEEKDRVPTAIKQYWPYRDELSAQNGVLFKGNRIIIPKSLHHERKTRVHSSHLGVESCL